MNIYTCTIFVKDIAYMYFDFIIRLVFVIEKKYLTLKIYFQSVLFFNEPSKLFLHTCTFSIFCILMDKERYTKNVFAYLEMVFTAILNFTATIVLALFLI